MSTLTQFLGGGGGGVEIGQFVKFLENPALDKIVSQSGTFIRRGYVETDPNEYDTEKGLFPTLIPSGADFGYTSSGKFYTDLAASPDGSLQVATCRQGYIYHKTGYFGIPNRASSEPLGTNSDYIGVTINSSGVYVATDSGEIFKSTDNADNFSEVTNFARALHSIDASETTIFVGAASGYVGVSTDNGVTWGSASSPLFGQNLNIVAISCTASLVIALANNGQIIRSVNNGVNWLQVSITNESSTFFDLEIGPSYILATSTLGIYKSTDDGQNWELVLSDPSDGSAGTSIRKISISDSFAIAGARTGFHISFDQGQRWIFFGLYSYEASASYRYFVGAVTYEDTESKKIMVVSNGGHSFFCDVVIGAGLEYNSQDRGNTDYLRIK